MIGIIYIFIPLLLLRHSSPFPIRTNSSELNQCSDNRTNCSDSDDPQPPKGLCLEKLGNGSYVYMVPHPDGSNRAFLCTQKGKIWLAMVPEVGSTQGLIIDESESDLFLDLSDQVEFGPEMGLISFAFHPNFISNGRFFAAYNCDKFKQSGCEGRCSCNSDVNCDPSKFESLQEETSPCQFHIVVSEFTANGTTASSKLSWTRRVNLVEVRRIFTMGLPFKAYHAGQILFGPNDGFLYMMIGDATHDPDPYNFAQNKKSLLGKILRIDIDIIPSEEEIRSLDLYGNYSIPKDNPYFMDKEFGPEVWALGFGNPWRCSFDSERPSHFICGDCGKNQYEEINVIKKGGNYGWRVYEGPNLVHLSYGGAPGGYTEPSSITPIFPVAGYSHESVDTSEGPASIMGGYYYRSATDPCLYGWYIYSDLYSYAIWAAIETSNNSDKLTNFRVPFRCANDSPIQCGFKSGVHQVPDLGYVVSFSEDNNKDVYMLTSSGVYRVAASIRCGYSCSKEKYLNLTKMSSSRTLLFKVEDFLACCFISLLLIAFL